MRNRTRRVIRAARGENALNALRLSRYVGLLASVGALVSGCSLSVPLAGLGAEDIATGTIRPAVATSPLAADLDAEDWRRAKSALDTALDPQGNGTTVAWDNPASGAKGAFVPMGAPYPKDDGICRLFAARVTLKGQSERSLRSSACRVNSGDWILGRVVQADPPSSRHGPQKRDILADRDTSTQLR